MKHIFLIAFCLMTISGFGQKIERFKEDYRDFETLYDAIIVKSNGDTLTGKMFHIKYSSAYKCFLYRRDKKNRLKKTKIFIIEINHLIIDGEYYGSIPRSLGKHAACYRILNNEGFDVYKTIGKITNDNNYGLNKTAYITKTTYHFIYYLYLDGQYHKLSDGQIRYGSNMERDKIYTIFSKYDYFKSKIDRKDLDMMSLEGIILLYNKLRKEHEAKK
jgi:hypothetical protein